MPIIRGSLKIPWTKDQEISQKLDPVPLVRVGLLYEERVRKQGEFVATEQQLLAKRMHDLDNDVATVLTSVTNRQKKFTKYLEKLNKVNELSHSLSKCHCILNEALEAIELLNNLLPPDIRLEPFVWTTG